MMRHIAVFFKKLVSSHDKKVLLENFLSLSFLQIANNLLPLITFPYLVRVLGPAKFGLIAFAQAFIQYFVLLTDYGFSLSATREISINRHDNKAVCHIFSSVMAVKFIFMLLSLFVVIASIYLIPKFQDNRLLYIFTFGLVLGNLLFPTWFFQGMERMRYITIFNVIGKIVFTMAVFIFIKTQEDFIYVPLIASIGIIVTGITGLWTVFTKFKVKFSVPGVKEIKDRLEEGWHIFISKIAVSLYTNTNTFLLGLLTNNVIVGYYSAAEKMIDAVKQLLLPFVNTIYPYMGKLSSYSKDRAVSFARKALILMGSGTAVMALLIIIFAGNIVSLLLGSQYTASVQVLRILSLLPFLVTLSNIFGVQIMLNFGFKKAFSRITISAAVLNILLALILIPSYKQIGISFCPIITEVFIGISMYYYLKRKRVLTLKFILNGRTAL